MTFTNTDCVGKWLAVTWIRRWKDRCIIGSGGGELIIISFHSHLLKKK